jgi:hypothetical protein
MTFAIFKILMHLLNQFFYFKLFKNKMPGVFLNVKKLFKKKTNYKNDL